MIRPGGGFERFYDEQGRAPMHAEDWLLRCGFELVAREKGKSTWERRQDGTLDVAYCYSWFNDERAVVALNFNAKEAK